MYHIPTMREEFAEFRQTLGQYLVDHNMKSPLRWLQLALHYVVAPALVASTGLAGGIYLLAGQTTSPWSLTGAMLIIMSLLQLGRWLRTGYGYRTVSATALGIGVSLVSFALSSALAYWRPDLIEATEIMPASLDFTIRSIVIYVVLAFLPVVFPFGTWSGGILVRYENGPFNPPTTYESRGRVSGYGSG